MAEIASAEMPPDKAQRVVAFEFTGTAAEYFRIWIVNLLLTVLTLGIYSAWAKVRAYRYLHGSTTLDGRSFEYTAEPMAILKGRVIAVTAFAFWYLASTFFPLIALLLLPPLLAAVPFVIVRSLKFRSFHTRYRNLRFHFHGTYKEAALTYLLWPFLSALSFGLLWPFFAYKRTEFTWDNLGFGDQRFSFSGEVGAVYRIYLALAGWIILAAVVALVAFFAIAAVAGWMGWLPDEDGTIGGNGLSMIALLGLIYLPLVIAYLAPPAYLKARMGNYALNNLNAAGHLPSSFMQVTEVIWIYVTNALAIVLSIGLAIPWATIRMARYRAAHTTVTLYGDLAAIGAGADDRVSATGEELGEVFDFDIGF